MVSAISQSSVSTAAGTDTATASADKAMGKDSFLKLLVAQISHQDPMKPQADTQFIAQLAQFSALEQQMSTNKMLEVIATGQRGLANTADVALVGKNVTVKGSTVALTESAVSTPLSFKLGGPAQKVTVSIQDSNGRTIRTMEAGAKEAGNVTVAWDGKDQSGTKQPPGAYTVSVTAESKDGSTVVVDQEMTGVVKSLSFESGYPMLMLDNGASAPTGNLLRVNNTGI